MYLNVIQLAESLGVEESVVEGWVRHEGLPCVHDRGRLLFDRAQVVAWAAPRGMAAKVGFLAPERTTVSPGCDLETLLRTGGIWRDVAGAGVIQVLERVAANLPGATPAVRQLLVQRLRLPDGVTWAPVGGALALPHLRVPVALGRDAGTLALLLLRDALPLKEPPPDDVPVTRLLFFIAPSPRAHLELLAQLSKTLSRGSFRQFVLAAAADAEIFAALPTAGPVTEAAGTMEDQG
jgi:PTS system nitrogen regulatory IIA component